MNASGSVGFDLSADGTTLALNYEKKIRMGPGDIHLWDLETGKSKAVLEGEAKAAGWRFSADGKTLALDYTDGTVKFWDVASRMERETVQPWPEIEQFHEFAYHSRFLAINPVAPKSDPALNHKIMLWDTDKQRVHAMLDGGADVEHVRFSPDGRLIAAGVGRQIKVWDVSTGTVVHILGGSRQDIVSIAFSPDGKMLAGGKMTGGRKMNDIKVAIWDLPDRK